MKSIYTETHNHPPADNFKHLNPYLAILCHWKPLRL